MGLTDRIARITYKPGWRIDVCLRIRVDVPDSRDPSKTFRLQSRLRIPPEVEAMSDAELAAWVRERLAVVETHELDEWCRLDGEMIRDPHAPAEPGPVDLAAMVRRYEAALDRGVLAYDGQGTPVTVEPESPTMADVCQVATSWDNPACEWLDSAGVACERLDPHPDGAHIVGWHTIEHNSRRALTCRAVENIRLAWGAR